MGSIWLTALCFAGTGCQDPCVALAERICNCEADLSERQGCRQERIQAQQSKTPTAEEQEVCTAALDLCTCEALRQNRVDLCGYTRDTLATPTEDGS